MAAMFGIAALTQGISSGITSFANIKKEQQADTEICNQITATSNILSQVDALTAKLVSLTAMDEETKNDIIGLNGTISAKIAKMKSEKKTFTTNVLIMIVMNIFLVCLIAIMLFS